MSATGLEVFDKTVQTTNIWLDELMADIGPDRHVAWHVLSVVTGTVVLDGRHSGNLIRKSSERRRCSTIRNGARERHVRTRNVEDTMSNPLDPNTHIEPRRRVNDRSANTGLIVAAVVALAILTGIFVAYSYQGSQKMDNTAAVEGSATGPAPRQFPVRPPETSNVPPARAPTPRP